MNFLIIILFKAKFLALPRVLLVFSVFDLKRLYTKKRDAFEAQIARVVFAGHFDAAGVRARPLRLFFALFPAALFIVSQFVLFFDFYWQTRWFLGFTGRAWAELVWHGPLPTTSPKGCLLFIHWFNLQNLD